jgi:hypothetical protein
MLDKIESALDKFNNSAELTKDTVNSLKEDVSPDSLDKLLEIVDQRIEATAQKLRLEMEENRRAERKHQYIILLVNIAVATMAIITYIFNRVL